ncbi:MAG: spore photoproduct lyase [Clostridium sp.]|uniref:spore photoproduct lyase n=1 Tax=Clostridium sp. TaxID=1506 RepID=UPI003F39A0F8
MFIPYKVVFDEKVLQYPLGTELLKRFKESDIEVLVNKGGRVLGKRDDSDAKNFFLGKRTLVIGVRKITEFQSCKPSANYQLPLLSGCSGMCEYCYLNTQLGKRPYTKIYVNVDEILNKAFKYVEERKPEKTVFEGAATSDPIPTEKYTGALRKTIERIGENEFSYFRFVTKFSEIDSLIGVKHNGHTTIRFSLNTNKIIDEFEKGTDSFEERVNAAKKLYNDGYKIGFIIAPVFLYDEWKDDYLKLISKISEEFSNAEEGREIEIEVISHRYTERAKNQILTVYPKSKLPMDKDGRSLKYGQFGYTKYVYDKENMKEMKEFFEENLRKYMNKCIIKYII